MSVLRSRKNGHVLRVVVIWLGFISAVMISCLSFEAWAMIRPWGSMMSELPQKVRFFSVPMRLVAQMYMLLAMAWERRIVIHASCCAACSWAGSLWHQPMAVG